MRNFIFALPLSVLPENVSPLLETWRMQLGEKKVIPGSSLLYDIYIKPRAAGLTAIFEEHRALTTDEQRTIAAHQSLLFLCGRIQTAADLREVNAVLTKILQTGALGVYAEHSGVAWSKASFLEFDLENEPMDFWLNFIETENDFFTLGMETFGLPDLCISKAFGNADNLCDLLTVAADSLFMDGVPAESGTKIDDDLGNQFVLRLEFRLPFSKTSPEYNKQQALRLCKTL